MVDGQYSELAFADQCNVFANTTSIDEQNYLAASRPYHVFPTNFVSIHILRSGTVLTFTSHDPVASSPSSQSARGRSRDQL